jgi:4'-phosphopantetheinyl transferase EntD
MKKAVLSSSQERPAWPGDQTHALAADDFRIIQALLPPSVLLLAAPVGSWMNEIESKEREIVQHAVRSRQNEFSTGRMLAAQALGELGAHASPVLRGSMNEPVWPTGVVGSITHTKDVCLVAVAKTKHLIGLGIDIEADRAEFANLAHLILRPEEAAATSRQTQSETASSRLAFCAKESVYKAIYNRANRFVDFQEVLVEIEPGAGFFTATAPDDHDLNALVSNGTGRYVVAGKLLFAAWYEQP